VFISFDLDVKQIADLTLIFHFPTGVEGVDEFRIEGTGALMGMEREH
jgi:hypothetical protein